MPAEFERKDLPLTEWTIDELRAGFEKTSNFWLDPYITELKKRETTQPGLAVSFFELFNRKDMRWRVIYLFIAIHDPAMIPKYGSMLETLFTEEAADPKTENLYEVQRIKIYDALREYPEKADTVYPILISALKKETWHNDPLLGIIEGLVAMGPANIPDLMTRLTKAYANEPKPIARGKEKIETMGYFFALQELGVADKEIEKLKPHRGWF